MSQEIIYARENGETRLKPSLFNPRYYSLKRLSNEVIAISKLFFKEKRQVIADLGCGNMPYKSVFTPLTESYVGIDLPENPNATIHIDPVGKINLEDNQVDAVLSTQVLEHVIDPAHYLSEAHRILKKEGLLILSTHGHWIYHPDPTDLWRWTSSGLKKVVEANGFEVIHFRGIMGRTATGLQIFQDGILFKLPKFIRPLYTVFMQQFIALGDKIHSQKQRDDDACIFILVAKKKASVN